MHQRTHAPTCRLLLLHACQARFLELHHHVGALQVALLGLQPGRQAQAYKHGWDHGRLNTRGSMQRVWQKQQYARGYNDIPMLTRLPTHPPFHPPSPGSPALAHLDQPPHALQLSLQPLGLLHSGILPPQGPHQRLPPRQALRRRRAGQRDQAGSRGGMNKSRTATCCGMIPETLQAAAMLISPCPATAHLLPHAGRGGRQHGIRSRRQPGGGAGGSPLQPS